MQLKAWGLTDVGQKRGHNEDAILLADELQLYAVADGMGGHTAGDRASRMAIEVLEQRMRQAQLPDERGLTPSFDDPAGRALEAAAKDACRVIYEEAHANPDLTGMGTTLTALLVHGGRAYTVHVGDSRAYLMRDDQLVQLTTDHTWIEEQVRAGFMTRDEAQVSDLRHIVTRSVGYEPEVKVDLLAMPTVMGDCFLLCSDGMANYVGLEDLRQVINSSYYGEVPQKLVDRANRLGGDDNITVVVVYVANDAEPAAAG